MDRDALVADDGSLISVLRLEGALRQVGVAEYTTIVRGLTEKLQSTLSRPGHSIQVVFEYDPEASGSRIREMLLPSRLTAQNLGLSIGPLLENWGQAMERYCFMEACWLVLWTRPLVLADSLRKNAMKERHVSMSKAPMQPGCQHVGAAIAALHDAHNGFLTGVLDAFNQIDLLVYPLTPHEALRDIRTCVDPEFTSRNWQARIPGDPLSLRLPDTDAPPAALLHNVIYPDFKTQLWPREGHLLSRSALQVGDRMFGPLIMTLMPQTPKPFQDFFRVLSRRDERMPYRVSFLLEPGGLQLGMKPLLSAVLAFANSDNKRFNSAVEGLRVLDLEGVCCVKFRICCCTWATIGELSEKNAHALLRRRMAELTKAIQGWGTADVTEAVGDPLLGLAATVPAMLPSSPAPITVAPLQEAIGMLPLRSASPWKEGSLLLRTQDGKLIPFAPNSSEQAAWIDLGVAPMGGGKSVFLNALNFAFVTQAGLSRLPWVSIIDVGPSSSGLITLLKENLPEGKKHLAAYHRLRMTEDYCINPFDTPLGCRKPLPAHRAFLVNLLTLLCAPLEAEPADKDVPGLVRRAIELAYDELSDEHNARLYQSNVLPELHTLLCKENIPLKNTPTWWEVVDALFDHGLVHEAIQAQRYAVPLLGDLSAQINQNQGIINTYEENTRKHVWRSVIDAIDAYTVLKEPTRFDLGDAQIVSLDLDEVATRGGPPAERQAAVMYMLARHVLGARFFLMSDDVKLMPQRYQAYHAERIEAIREDPKRLCVDDGSTDSSGVICNRLAEGDCRLKIIHTNNQGLSNARNLAMDMARGEYVLFLDADDWLELDAVEKLYSIAAKSNPDIVQFGYYIARPKSIDTAWLKKDNGTLLKEATGLRDRLCNAFHQGPMVWKFLWRRRFIAEHALRFHKGLLFEDFDFTARGILYAHQYILLHERLYYYRQRFGSISDKGECTSKVNGVICSFSYALRAYKDAVASEECIKYLLERKARMLKKLYLDAPYSESKTVLAAIVVSTDKWERYLYACGCGLKWEDRFFMNCALGNRIDRVIGHFVMSGYPIWRFIAEKSVYFGRYRSEELYFER